VAARAMHRFLVVVNFLKYFDSQVRTENCPLFGLWHGWHHSLPCRQNRRFFSSFVRHPVA
jgi:hypothetical protein